MTARRLSLRMASPQSQRAKADNIERTKVASAARKLQKAMAAPVHAVEMRPDDRRGFAEWWRQFLQRGLTDDLSDDEVGALHALAWAHYHAVHPANSWRDAVAALVARRKAASPPEPSDYWKRGRGYGGPTPRDDGW